MTSQEPTNPPSTLNQPEPAFGWTAYAEQINGRFAMIGFVALLILELFTQQDFWTWIGLR
jgi:hypothetical protein